MQAFFFCIPEADIPEADIPEADIPEADIPEADKKKPHKINCEALSDKFLWLIKKGLLKTGLIN